MSLALTKQAHEALSWLELQLKESSDSVLCKVRQHVQHALRAIPATHIQAAYEEAAKKTEAQAPVAPVPAVGPVVPVESTDPAAFKPLLTQ